MSWTHRCSGRHDATILDDEDGCSRCGASSPSKRLAMENHELATTLKVLVGGAILMFLLGVWKLA